MADRVMTAHVPEALAREVDLEQHRRMLTLEGLRDVDAGRVVDHEAVETWAAKRGLTPARSRRPPGTARPS